MNQFTRQCEWCMEQFDTPYKDKLYCSKLCSQRARDFRKRARAGKQRPIYKRICKGCAENFVTKRQNQLYCCEKCGDWMREQTKRENAKKRDAVQWKAANRPTWKAKIYYRDKGICQLCYKPIDLTLEHPNQMSFSIDHIVPVSMGGDHILKNLQSAHLICNSKRGNKPIGEWQ